LAIHPKLVIPQNPQREEVILPLQILSNDFGRSLNFLLHKRYFSAYSLNLQKRSLRKLFKSDPLEEYLGRLKDGKSSDAIVGEQNHLENNPIFSPSMPTLDHSMNPPLNPSLTLMNPLMLILLNLLTILEIHLHIPHIGIIYSIRRLEKSNINV